MQIFHFGLLYLLVAPSCGVFLDHSADVWKIAGVSLTPDADHAHRLPADTVPNRLTVAVSNAATGVHFELSSDVRLTAVKESFVTGSKLVALGTAGRASSVVIFDLLQRREVDWFFCIEPRRVSDNWIVYVQWYPRFVQGQPREVVLLYDLTRSPADNRLPNTVRLNIPAPISAAPIQVGVPIYPESNVRLRSYSDVVENPAEGETILAYLSFWLLSRERLVFVGAQGRDFPSSHNYLVVVDLSRGVDNPTIDTIDIPKDQLQKPGENPRFVQITGIDQVSENAVRLLVPKSEYGVSSIVVNLSAP